MRRAWGRAAQGREAGVGALRLETADKLVKMSKGVRGRRRPGGRFSRLLRGRSVTWRRVILPGGGGRWSLKAISSRRVVKVTGGRKVVKSLQVGIRCRICRGYRFRLVVLKKRVGRRDITEEFHYMMAQSLDLCRHRPISQPRSSNRDKKV